MSTLRANNYREQPELPCCDNCKWHCEQLDGDALGSCDVLRVYVGHTDICDRYEQQDGFRGMMDAREEANREQ